MYSTYTYAMRNNNNMRAAHGSVYEQRLYEMATVYHDYVPPFSVDFFSKVGGLTSKNKA